MVAFIVSHIFSQRIGMILLRTSVLVNISCSQPNISTSTPNTNKRASPDSPDDLPATEKQEKRQIRRPLRLNIFSLFVILSLTQLYRYTPEIFLFSTATFKYTYRATLRRIGQAPTFFYFFFKSDFYKKKFPIRLRVRFSNRFALALMTSGLKGSPIKIRLKIKKKMGVGPFISEMERATTNLMDHPRQKYLWGIQ
jgi:hypothetical protein